MGRVGSCIACGFVGCALVGIQAALKELKDLHGWQVFHVNNADALVSPPRMASVQMLEDTTNAQIFSLCTCWHQTKRRRCRRGFGGRRLVNG